MTVNDCKLEIDLPIALFGSTIPAAFGSVICLILMCWSARPQVHMGNYLLSEPPSYSLMLRFMGRLHLGRVRTGEECVGSDEAHPLSCHCQGMLIADYPADSFTAARRCRPGVRCCSGHYGSDRGMGRKGPGP